MELVLEGLRDHPRRLITIEVKGLPISFKALPRSTREKLLERGGPEFPASYDRFVARELVTLLDGIRAARPKSPITIQGLPFDGDGRNDSLANERFASVIDRLSAFVLERGVVVSSRTDEQEIVSRLFPNAIDLADGRALIYPLNLGWRLAIEGESLVSEDAVGSGEPRIPENLRAGKGESSARDEAAPVMSDLDDFGVAGRGEQPTGTGSVAGAMASNSPGAGAPPSVAGTGEATSPTGGFGGGGGAALPFGLNDDDEDPPADDEAGEDPPADEGDDEDPPADEGDDADQPADEGDDEDPPADEGDDENPPADDEAGEDPPADEGDDEDPPADEGDDDDPPADDEAGEDPPADEGDDEDPPADDEAGEDPPADEGDDEDPPADDEAGEDPPADEGDDEDPPADDEAGEDPPADEGDGWNPGDEVEDPPADDPPADDPPADDPPADDPPADGSGDADSEQDPVVFETFAVLRDLLNQTPAGATLDLDGRSFAAVVGDTWVSSPAPITVTNGTIYGAIKLDWTSSGNENFVTAGLGDEIEIDFSAKVIDKFSSVTPTLAVWPDPPASVREYPTTLNDSWIVVRDHAGTMNGTVDTLGGVNASGYRITGFQITNPAILAQLRSALDGIDVSKMVMFHHSMNNIVGVTRIESWSPSTGVMVVDSSESLEYSSYLSFILAGSESFIRRPGDYAISVGQKEITYWPASGSDGTAAMYPILPVIWWDLGSNATVFEDVDFIGGNMRGGAPALYRWDGTQGTPIFRRCEFRSGGSGIRGSAEIYDCEFHQMVGRGAAVGDGAIIERSRFTGMEKSSAILVMAGQGVASDVPVRKTIIRDNFFSLPLANHGQGISLYHCSWQNAIVEHNIFLDCQRAISFQNGGVLRETPGELRIENNLVIVDDPRGIADFGQQTVSFNSGSSTHLDERQKVFIRSNTIVGNPDVPGAGRWSIDLAYMQVETRRIENNFVASISACPESPDNNAQQHANNFFAQPLWGAALSSLDDRVVGDFSSCFDYERMRPANAASQGASDGLPVGIRWGGEITIEDVRDLPKDWYDQWPALEIPAVEVTAPAWWNQDLR
ncbi:MAG: hypothetical protein CMJ54_10470 [Planctomycetaceae bacterium]|nr:hypothetical protein [Planctomycetaceae bacterium]